MCEDSSKIKKIICLDCNTLKILLFIIGNIFTCFLLSLFVIWYPRLKIIFIYSQVPLRFGKSLGIEGQDGQFYIVELDVYKLPDLQNSHLKTYCRTNIRKNENDEIKAFTFKQFKYIFNYYTLCFHSMKFEIKTTHENIHTHFIKGLKSEEVAYQTALFGECNLNIQVDSSLKLLVKELTDPFYIFQVCSFILWMNNNYQAYAIVIIIATLISLIISVKDTRSNLLSLKEMAKYSCPVNVYRMNSTGEKVALKMSSVNLVPGDIFELPEDGFALPCDLILISGTVIVNESMLTGESTPIIKTHLPNSECDFDAKNDKKYLLYSGTKIIQKRNIGEGKVMGLVLSTGFNTFKGNLIRSILFPKEVNFKFKNDSFRYIMIMTVLSFIGFGISFPFLVKYGYSYGEILTKSLDLITTTVPPSLPACIGIGISYALSRLKVWGIVCINRERINIIGKVNMICFDKTGTLTEDNLDILGFRPVKLSKNGIVFDGFISSCLEYSETASKYYKEKKEQKIEDKDKDLITLFIESLASCHGITRVNEKLVGDPIDVKMFEASNWIFKENVENEHNYDALISAYVRPPLQLEFLHKVSSACEDEGDIKNFRLHYELGIVRRFDFSSKLQRMSTLVKDLNDEYFKAFCKGSPEKIKELCLPQTIPSNFNEVLTRYTSKGFRVLALAGKMIKMTFLQSQKIIREKVECDMIFLGLLIVQNKLKAKTTETINSLYQADLRMIMATGDNILTAISVAKECKLINPNAKVCTCEVSRCNNKSNLIWNIIENYTEEDDERFASQIFEESGKVAIDDNVINEGSSQLITQALRPDSFSLGRIRKFSGMKGELDELRKKSNQIFEEDALSVDIEAFPFSENIENEDFVIAVTGPTFESLWNLKNKYLSTKSEQYKSHYEMFRIILRKCFIFARMSPEHKTILVECLREEKFTVCMCGDGANDCGALRSADVGVSLSAQEASIAAHFTSQVADISCLIKLLREGKASLVTSIQTFKYMMIYSLIQFISVTLLMLVNSYLADFQFLASDLFIIFPLAFLIARTGAYNQLTYHKPTAALISVPIVSSIVIQALIAFAFQYGGWLLLTSHKKWYRNFCKADDDNVQSCYDNTAIFLISNMQYLITAIAFSISKPFRKPISSNYLLLVFIVFSFAYSVYIIIAPDFFSSKLLKLEKFPDTKFKYYIFLLTLANLCISFFAEKKFIPCISRQWNFYKDNKKYQKITKQQQYNLKQIYKSENVKKDKKRET